MRTRIKEVKYSDGSVIYTPQVKQFGYELEHDLSIKDLGGWYLLWLFVPLANIVYLILILAIILPSLGWQTFNESIWSDTTWQSKDLNASKNKIDDFLAEYQRKLNYKPVHKISKSFIKHP